MTISPVSITNPVSELKSKIEQRQARIAIIGLGYVGLPLALLYTEEKFRVTGFDIDQRKVTTLTKGGSYIVRILPAEIQQARSQGTASQSIPFICRGRPRNGTSAPVSSNWPVRSTSACRITYSTTWPKR